MNSAEEEVAGGLGARPASSAGRARGDGKGLRPLLAGPGGTARACVLRRPGRGDGEGTGVHAHLVWALSRVREGLGA